MPNRKEPKRPRRTFTDEFKRAPGRRRSRPLARVSRDPDLTETSLRERVQQVKTDTGRAAPSAITSSERDELRRLRDESRVLKMEREILKKAAVFFAKESR